MNRNNFLPLVGGIALIAGLVSLGVAVWQWSFPSLAMKIFLSALMVITLVRMVDK